MTHELILLNVLLAVLFVLGPVITNHFFLYSSKTYKRLHITTLTILAVSFFLKANILNLIWLIFCLFGLFLYVYTNKKNLFTLEALTKLIPFTFSIISALWFFCGSNNLYLLGYNINWSFYAALHAGFLGWLLLSCFLVISKKTKYRSLYQLACYIFFASFLLIALGIDGIPYIKRIGSLVIILSCPLLVGFYAFSLTKVNTCSRFLAISSFLVLIFSLLLAFENEFLITLVSALMPSKPMVYIHGSLNGFIALPALSLSLLLEDKRI